MDFDFTEEQKLLRQSVQDFCRKEVTPELLRDIDAKREFPKDLRAKMASLGWYGILVPEQYGGMSGTAIDVAILNEEQGRGGFGCDFIPTAIFGGTTSKSCSTTSFRRSTGTNRKS